MVTVVSFMIVVPLAGFVVVRSHRTVHGVLSTPPPSPGEGGGG